jgi:hypothetical protein
MIPGKIANRMAAHESTRKDISTGEYDLWWNFAIPRDKVTLPNKPLGTGQRVRWPVLNNRVKATF